MTSRGAGRHETRFIRGAGDDFNPRGHGAGKHIGVRGLRGSDGAAGGRGAGGRGGGRRRLFDSGELRLLLLHLIAQGPRHGYDLIRAMEELSGGAYAPSPGMVYPLLTMLAEMELVSEQADGARKLFAITDAGTAVLTEEQAALEAALSRLQTLAVKADRVDGAPIRRAMENLKMALRNRLEKEGADADTMFDVVALIDDAAAKIERLK
jgi:DNA-binding PadR family transcriptional regulator